MTGMLIGPVVSALFLTVTRPSRFGLSLQGPGVRSLRSLLYFLIFAMTASLSIGCTSLSGNGETPIVSQSDLEQLIEEHPLFAGSAIVVQDGAITAIAHAGIADRDTGRMNSAKTMHSVASVGKMFTAVAIIQLIESGKFEFDTPVTDVIPELGDRLPSTVTVDHLLHHTSGIGSVTNVDDATLDALRNNADYFALILSSGVRSNGPADFSYRNENFQILGEIIQRTSDEPYEAYIRKNIADPLGMSGPLFVRRDLDRSHIIASDYLPVDFQTWWNSDGSFEVESASEFIHAAPPATPSAGGGSYVTATDLVRFATGFKSGKLITTENVKTMCSLVNTNITESRGYGRGCAITKYEDETRVGHTGSAAGIQARFFMYLERGVDVIVLSNHDGQAAPLFDDIEGVVLDKPWSAFLTRRLNTTR